jgi:hypothetical protein
MRSISFLLAFFFLSCPVFAQETYIEPRYQLQYQKDFFKTGGAQIKFNPDEYLRIGVLIENKTNWSLNEILNIFFSVAPFDRYRNFFEFTMTQNIDQALALKNEFLTAYDGWGNRLAGGFDISSTRIQASLIILKVGDVEFFKTGTRGYSRGKTAVAQPYTILHELGHVLARLGDEYSVQEGEEYTEFETLAKSMGEQFHSRLSGWRTQTKPNLDLRTRKVLKWQPLIDQGFIPTERIERKEFQYGGKEVGRFVIPTAHCVMNNPERDNEFCPVCQLQIIEMICQFTGAPIPWEDREN